MRVGDVMRTRCLVSARPEDDVAIAAQLMRSGATRYLPVVKHGQVVGVLSERDLLRHRGASGRGPARTLAGQVMSTPAQVIAADADLAEASALMLAGGIGCLPVVEEGRLVGLLTMSDVANAAAADASPALPAFPPDAPRVADAMQAHPATVRPWAPLLEAVALMLEHGFRHVPVTDEDGRLVGIISDRDVRTALGDPAEALVRELEETDDIPVSTAMTAPVVTVRADAPLAEAAACLVDRRIGAVPVVDPDGRLVGILSTTDVIREARPRLAPRTVEAVR